MSAIKRIVFFLHLVFDYVVDYLYDFYYRGQKQLAPPVRSPILLLSATEMARKIRQKEIKSEELVKLHMERIREINGLLNAVIDERFEKALEEARKVDEDIENGVYTEEDFEKKFFLGVPFTTKGTTHCEGLDVSFGIVGRKGMKGTEDADIVKFVKDTGAILIALTNVPQLSIWTETHNPIFGITRNPYDTTRNVGGSSGGEATLVASCSTAISVGTDIGGSVRIPSFMCGTFGHKCSTQLTSTKGLTYRDGSDRETTMVVTGPLARHAEDLIPGVKAVLGPAHKKLQLDKKVDVTKLRYHVVEELGDLYCSPARSEMKKSLAKVVKHFKEIAGNVESLNLEGFSHSAKLYRYWMSKDIKNFARDITGRKETLVWYKELIKYFTGKSDLSFSAVMVICNSQLLPDVDDSWATKTTDKLKSELLSKLGDDGVLLFLSSPTTAHHHHVSYLRPFNLAYFGIFNVLRLPATQVPLGLSADGLPLGVQVVAGPLQDHLCIAVAKELEKAFGGYVPPFKMEN